MSPGITSPAFNRHPENVEPSRPKVSLGLPVYNGEKFLETTLESIVAQTFTDFELIIGDNASSDRTREICEKFSACDDRIQYSRNPKNLGAARNYNQLFEMATGKYFKWIAHDDPIAPTLLEACVNILDNHPEAVMSYGKTILIDEHDEVIEYHQDNYDLRDLLASTRLHRYFSSVSAWCHPVFGLIRSEILARTGLIGNYASSDKVLLAELAILGQCHEVSEWLAFRRLHPQISTEANRSDEMMALWFDPQTRWTWLTPRWRRFIELFKAVQRAQLTTAEEARCYGTILRFYLSPGRLSGIQKELIQVGRNLLRISKNTLKLDQDSNDLETRK